MTFGELPSRSAGMAAHRTPIAAPAERLADRLETPALDDRSYRVVRLPNKLEVLLVHDPDTDKASAALDVNVGNFSDREDMPGMAHAVEHLLFMGTEKYPKENAYSQYLTSHSGYSNAYTAATSTNYFFEVAASAGTTGSEEDAAPAQDGPPASGETVPESPLYGALDRFAQFFIAPLFLSSTLDRELKAVDSENKKNLQNDTWRLNQLAKSLSNPKHPYCHFSTGNLDTLRDGPRARGVEIRDEFIRFHEQHYSANRMKLVILGRESLDELEAWAVELFSAIRNKDLPQNRWDAEQPFTDKELLTQYFAKPVMDMRELDLVFPFLDEETLFESHPGRYLSHLIGHEGPGSILSFIKAKGWANGLGAGSSPICPGSASFSITIRLTEDGLKSYREVVKTVFRYIALLRETPPQSWIVDEMAGMAEVNFRFRQKSPASKFTSRISTVMQKPVPREWLLSATSLIRKFDSDAISTALSYLRPDNFRMALISPDLSEHLDQKEKWYGTEYRCEKIPVDFLAEIQRAGKANCTSNIPDLYLPAKNEFIPTNLEVERRDVKEPLKAPRLVRNEESARIWWKKDDRFWVPKGYVWITLRNALSNATPGNVVKTKLYCELVKDALVEYSYDAEIAGLDYGLGSHTDGLDVEVSGYNDKMSVLLEKVLLSMRDLEVKPDRFKVVKERLLRAYRNWGFQQPYHQIGEYTRWLGVERRWINDQCLDELVHVAERDVRDFYPQLLRQVHVEALVHGNLHKEEALRLSQLVEGILKPRALPQSQWSVHRALILPPGSNHLYSHTLKDPANVNHCIEYYLFVGDVADRMLRSKLALFAQTTDEPGFDQLRTKEQLGYVVFTGVRMQATVMGYRVLVQSERTPAYLETRIDAFLGGFGARLEEMSDDDFEAHKRSLINKRLEKLKNLGQETQRFWSHIGNEFFDFDQVDLDVACLKTLTKPDLIDFYRQYISPSSPTRAKLSVHMVAQATPADADKDLSPDEQKEKVVAVLTQHLASRDVETDAEKLQGRFAEVDLASADQEAILAVVGSHLRADLKLDATAAQAILAEGKALLPSLLPALGAQEQAEAEQTNGVGADGPKKAGAVTVIENVHEFKAGLAVTAGPRAVKDLSEFEETAPKL
ncbi:MAG: Insulinase (Peptidase M16) [Thelocarpon impressellum]|nr:MAG: Insulinase (Peptidase M16) [Thelocarpon impressellum]